MEYKEVEPLMDIEHFAELFTVVMSEEIEDVDGKVFRYDWNCYLKEIEETLSTDSNDNMDYRYLIDTEMYNNKKNIWEIEFASDLRQTTLNGRTIPAFDKEEMLVVFDNNYVEETLNKYTPDSIEMMRSFTEKVKNFKNNKVGNRK